MPTVLPCPRHDDIPEEGHMPMLSWLERTLLEERRGLDAALAVKHAALLTEISPYLQGIEWKPSNTEKIPRLRSPWWTHVSDGAPHCAPPIHHVADEENGPRSSWWVDVRNRASQATSPRHHVADEEVGHHVGSTGDRDTETMAVDSNKTNIVMPNSDDVAPSQALSDGLGAPSQALSDGLGASRRMDSKSHGRSSKSRLALYTGRQTKKLLQDIVALHPATIINGAFARLEQFIKGTAFEAGFALVILAQTFLLAVEAQYKGFGVGWKVGYPGPDAHEAWPGATDFFEVAELIFGVLFSIELLLKLACLRKRFCSDAWNIMDTIIVIGWFLTLMGLFPMPTDPTLLRVVRLSRLVRVLRLIRTIRAFDSLYLMTTAMLSSLSVLLWSVVLLGIVQVLIALFLQTLLEEYILDEQKPEAARRQVFMFYGTFLRTMLTLFEMALGNWMPPCRALVEHVSEWWMFFSLAHKLVIGFSVLAVMNSVFIQETFRVAAIDDKIMIMNKERSRKAHIQKMNSFFGATDYDGNGLIDVHEFMNALADSGLRTWLSSMEVEVRDTFQLFQLLDVDRDGQITVQDLVDGISRIKGTAKSYDVVYLQNLNMKLMKDVQLVQKELKRISATAQAPCVQTI